MPAAITPFKIHGTANENQLAVGGGNIYLFPPPLTYATGGTQAKLDEMSGWLWADETKRELNEWLKGKPWCSPSDDGIKTTMKEKKIEFGLNNQAKIERRTGTLDEASLSFKGMDIFYSTAHYLDIMGDEKAIFFKAKADGSEGSEAGTEWIVDGPSKFERKVFIAHVSLGDPEHVGRCAVVWYYGAISSDVDIEDSINNPLSVEIKFDLRPFPNITQPNGNPIYRIIEIPVGAKTAYQYVVEG
jgi:hypothetical protein